MKRFIGFIGFVFSVLILNAQPFTAVIDAAGTGDYTTFQAAIDAMPSNSSSRSIIFVKAGTYTEKVLVGSDKSNLSIIGEDVDKVILSYNDYAGKNGMSSAESYTLLVQGSDFYMENVTVKNTAGKVGQALAINTEGDRGVYKNCKFYGFQDTYYAHKNRQYNYKCLVEGGTDFIYGDATAVFDYCQINCVNGGQYITAPADTKLITQFTTRKFLHGLLFRMCDITANSDVATNSYYLGRPWQPDASSVFAKCTIDAHIKPIGWSTWNDDTHLSSYFAEFKNVDTEGDLVDISNRADWSYQLSDTQFNNLYKLEFFFRKSMVEWDALAMTRNLLHPENVRIEENSLTWDAVDQAIGYVIYNNGAVYATTTETSIAANDLAVENVEVKSVYKTGALSNEENNDLVSKQEISQQNISFTLIDKVLTVPNAVQLSIFNLNGQKVLDNNYSCNHNLKELGSGVYLLHLKDEKGNMSFQRILF